MKKEIKMNLKEVEMLRADLRAVQKAAHHLESYITEKEQDQERILEQWENVKRADQAARRRMNRNIRMAKRKSEFRDVISDIVDVILVTDE